MFKTLLNIPASLFQGLVSAFNSILSKIKSPLQADFLSLRSLLYAFLIGAFIAMVAITVQPFGIADFTNSNKVILQIGLGVSAFIGLIIANFGLPLLLKSFYNKLQWTVGKAIINNIIGAFFLGLAVMVFANQTGIAQFELPAALLKFTFIIALLSIVGNIIRHSVLNNSFINKAEVLTSRFESQTTIENKNQIFPIVKFTGANDVISLVPNQLIKVDVNKYSSEFVYQNLFGVAVKTLDIPSKQVIEELKSFEQYGQLNKTVYVNKNAITKAEGDAAGIQLAIHRTNDLVRVPKKFLRKL